eukprot:scaffold9903_cov106-Isochrysis_galbana.AAC.1
MLRVSHLESINLSINFHEDLGRVQGHALQYSPCPTPTPTVTVARFVRPRLSGNEHPAGGLCALLQPAVVVHAALKPSPRKWRPEEGDGMGKEWDGGGGVSGQQGTEGVPPSRR